MVRRAKGRGMTPVLVRRAGTRGADGGEKKGEVVGSGEGAGYAVTGIFHGAYDWSRLETMYRVDGGNHGGCKIEGGTAIFHLCGYPR